MVFDGVVDRGRGQNGIELASVGGGIVLSNNVELNAGADWSKRTAAVTASAVVRF